MTASTATAQTLGRLVQAAGLSDGVLRRDPRALRLLDDVVQGQVLSDWRPAP
jgi:hypothetical protein